MLPECSFPNPCLPVFFLSACLQGDPYDPSSPTLIFAWGVEGAFATKEEAKQAFIAALKQVDEPSSSLPACPCLQAAVAAGCSGCSGCCRG